MTRFPPLLVALVACLPQQGASFITFLPSPARPSTVSRGRQPVSGTSTCPPSRPGRLICSTPAGDETENEIPKALDRSAPPSFIKDSNLSSDKPFVVSKEGEPTAEEMSNDNLLHILAQTCTDEEVNWLAWKCLGYRYDAVTDTWSSDGVFPLWKKRYPEAPDLIGVTRIYEREVDLPVYNAVQAITGAIPREHKNGLREQLRPLGFSGYLLNELTPNRTRRAQSTNFIIFFRDHMWGVPLDELERRRQARKKAAEEREQLVSDRAPLTSEEDTGSTKAS